MRPSTNGIQRSTSGFAKKLFLLIFFAMPLIAEAQYFKPDVPEGRGAYLFNQPALTRGQWGGKIAPLMIFGDEKVLVTEVRNDGWCRVTYTIPDEKLAKNELIRETIEYRYGKMTNELTGCMKIKALIPLDDTAAQMKETAVDITLPEYATLMWCIIILAALLLTLWMNFLGWLQPVILVAGLLLLSGIEIYFLSTTFDGFSFYSPNVHGWGTAILRFIGFAVFLLLQLYVWFKTILYHLRSEAQGIMLAGNIGALTLVIAAMLVMILLAAANEYDKWGTYIKYGYAALQGIFIIIIIFTDRLRALLTAPFYAVTIAAISLMAMDVIVVAILIVLGMLALPSFVQAGTTSQTAHRDVTTGRVRWRTNEGIDIRKLWRK